MSDIICWWSGGVTSAVACKIAIDIYGKDNCRVVFIDTYNESDDTYRFKNDCQAWYGINIETITEIGNKYQSIQDVWRKRLSLNVATGAICSSELKRRVREKWEKDNKYSFQVFGFDIDEPKRAKSMAMNNPNANPIFPLLMFGLSKKDCIGIIEDNGIGIPEMYHLGFLNNNCFKTGCVQGGIGYWQKIQREYPDKFMAMAKMEHELTDKKGSPVTMLRSQKNGTKTPLFLIPHPNYPELPKFSEQDGREPEPLFECNGFCGINDLEKRSNTESEINYQLDLWQREDDFKLCEHKFERGYVSDMCVYCIKCNKDADEIYPGMSFTDQLKLVCK